MSESLEIIPVCQPAVGRVRPPGSKSITNRALICAALATGNSTLRGALDSEDTQVMIDGLRQLGITVDRRDSATLSVAGCGGTIPNRGAELFVAGSGTTMRFLTALATLGEGRFRLSGIARMHERPIADLLDALRRLGATVRSQHDNGCPPAIVDASGLPGGRAAIRGDLSSQFLSGLLMVCPYARRDVRIDVEGKLVSQPYVTMTLEVMRAFGVDIPAGDLSRFDISAGQTYAPRDYAIEPDASAASYFFAAAAITGGRVMVEGLSLGSLQGDIAFCDCLRRMGCQVQSDRDSITVRGGPLVGIDVDMNPISDTAQTLAVVALFAQGVTRITGIGHIRHKETDRIAALATELRKLGAEVQEQSDGLVITPAKLAGASVATYNDHRMAMSFSLAGLKVPGVSIENPRCTEKTYPRYFDDLGALTATKPA